MSALLTEAEREKLRREALRDGRFDDQVLRLARAVTPQEKQICQNIVVFGVSYLHDTLGWAAGTVDLFMERREVRREIEALAELYKDREGVQERTRWFAQLKVNGMVPAALAILAKALRGDVLEGDNLREKAPTRSQVEAAIQVLDRANVTGAKSGAGSGLPPIDARQINIQVNNKVDGLNLATDEREKVVKTVFNIMNKLRAISKAAERVPAKHQPPVDGDDDLRDASPETAE